MTRRDARELAFVLLFEKIFTDASIDEIAQNAHEARDLIPDEFALRLATGTEEHLAQLDGLIEPALQNWSKERLSRVALTVLRLAVYEMRFEDETPDGVAINEAVEIAKKYGGEEDARFINGVLGTLSRA